MRLIIALLLMTAISTGCTRSPQTLTITDLQGVSRPYYQENEAMVLKLGWDYSRDAGKVFTCSFADTFSGEVVWRGITTAPEVAFGQKIVLLDWSPPLPEGGIKAKGGEYITSCNFGNESVLSLPVSVRKPFTIRVTDLKGDVRPYFAADEAVMLWVSWDIKHDAEKTVGCFISNSISGEQIWHGAAKTPLVASSKRLATLEWQPQFPSSGIKLKRGVYSASCNFNNETTMTVPISVTNVRAWP